MVLPKDVSVQLATLVDEPPSDPGWIYEVKFDGFRSLAFISKRRVELLSRNGLVWTDRFAHIAEALRALPVKEAVLDGEIAALGEGTETRTSFQRLGRAPEGEVRYYVFDLLFLDGRDLRHRPLIDRKAELERVLAKLPDRSPLRFSQHVEGDGNEIRARACRDGLEGIVAKRKDGIHQPRRTMEWLKIKCGARQEFVVGGFTEPKGARNGIGALLLGVYDRTGSLLYAGKVGTGFSADLLAGLARRLGRIEVKTTPFSNPPSRKLGVHWVKPELVAEVAFTEWTDDGRLRHPTFIGLREDKRARDVVREGH